MGVRMSFREWLGLILTVIGLVLTPVAWAFSRPLWVLAFGLMWVGLMLFFTDRVYRRLKKSSDHASGSGSTCGHAMPTDINNYTGWRSGGRAESFDSHSSGSADVGD
jgi:drug/metabolite transporter (DMT)-like permease